MNKPDLTGAEIFQEAYHDGNAHQRLYHLTDGRWMLNSWVGHQTPTKWAEIGKEAALEWLDTNGWQPEQITYGSGPGQRVYTRSIEETSAAFQARVNKAVLAHQRA